MPFYEYECKSCKHRFEEFQPISDEPIKVCPKCGEEPKRLISNLSSQVKREAKDQREIILEEARRDVEDIKNGDMEKAADYLGENGMLEYYNTK